MNVKETNNKTKATVNKEEIQRILVRLKDLCEDLEIALGNSKGDEFVLPENSGGIFEKLFDAPDRAQSTDNFDVEVEATNIIRKIGIPASLSGYEYLRYAITLTVDNRNMVTSITKKLYPEIAKKYSKTPSKVERAMRHAIETAFDRGDTAVLERYFGHSVSANKGKPTNSEFVALLADEIRLKRKAA